MKKKILLAFILCIILSLVYCVSSNAMTIVLDPGHGGVKPENTEAIGCENGNLKERELTLKIGMYLRDYLNQYENVNIIMTRTDDSALTVYRRAIIARENKADLLVSLHINDASDTSTNGVEVFVTGEDCLDMYNKNMTELGNRIVNNITSLGIGNRGVKTRLRSDPMEVYSTGHKADYYGIICYAMRGTKIDKLDANGNVDNANGTYQTYIVDENGNNVIVDPSYSAKVENGEGIPTVLVEHAFIRADSIYLDSDEDLKKLAEADGKAIVDQYNLKLKGTPTPIPTPTPTPAPTEDITTPIVNKDETIYVEDNVQALAFALQSSKDRVTENDIKQVYKNYNAQTEDLSKVFVNGDKIKIDEKEYAIIIYGDTTCDGKLSISDATKIIGHIVDETGSPLTSEQFMASDLDKNGKISISDATKLIGILTEQTKYSEIV